MMVTFVSQCQKNALKKTRRVLDAFADRIGDNTWQSVITEDGLAVVKKMLRQTASKNTAVACHWIRSRARSEFIWAVGNKEQFDEMGRVAVNYTTDEIKIDESKIMTTKVYANTKQQPLEQHLYAVGYVAHQLVTQLLRDDKLAMAAYVAGAWHDIGKLDPEFQAWLAGLQKKIEGLELPEDGLHIDKGKFTFETHARHNEISVYLYHLMDDDNFKGINQRNKDLIRHVIYWHHAKPIRKEEFTSLDFVHKRLWKSLGTNKLKDFYAAARSLLMKVNDIASEYEDQTQLKLSGYLPALDEDKLYGLEKKELPDYKSYSLSNETVGDHVSNVNENAKKSIARAAVISADRLVSALSKEQLATHIQQGTLTQLVALDSSSESALTAAIQQCLQGFESAYPNSERNLRQSDAAKKLSNVKGVAVLNGPAGCGKTKIALEWALLSSVKKIIWICPRVQVCEGLFHDLTLSEYLSNARVEICTGELKEIRQNGVSFTTPDNATFSGDIVLTTIDQVINALITHTNVTSLIDFMNTHVVFDEYHEYIHMPAFNLLFAELVQCKQLQENAKTLLVSATPNYFFVQNLLGIEREDIIGIDSFNQSQYQISFEPFDENKRDDSNPLFSPQPTNSIVISNTATTAQLSFIRNQRRENAVLFHSKFKQADKKDLFDKIFASFKQDGSRAYEVLRSGPVVQASLNITCEHMVTEFTNAENWLQRLGRLDRFGENTEVNQYVTALPEAIAASKGIKGSCAKFLQRMNSFLSAKAWYEYLKSKEVDAKPHTIAELYQLYEDFYVDSGAQKEIEKDLINALKTSVQLIQRKVHDPICFPKKKAANDKKKIKKSSLRGDNRFVQMAICKISADGKPEVINQYACDEASNIFTMSVTEIEGYDAGGDKNMLSFMHQKHHKIMSAKYQTTHKQAHKSFLLEKEAIDPEHPIYVSYTLQDLALCNDQPHSHAIYYAVSTTQTIGAMSIDKLNHPPINED